VNVEGGRPANHLGEHSMFMRKNGGKGSEGGSASDGVSGGTSGSNGARGSTRSKLMVAIGLVVLVLLVWQCKDAITVNNVNSQPHSRSTRIWDYYPSPTASASSSSSTFSRPKYGIMMGGTSDYFRSTTQGKGELSPVIVSTCIAKLYAIKQGYAFKLVTDLEKVSNRKYGACSADRMSAWHKIKLVREYLPDVDYVLWLDLDALIVRPYVPLDAILKAEHRVSSNLGTWMCAHTGLDMYHRNITGSAAAPFLYASQDINPRYKINLNTGVFAIKNAPISFNFLRRVWDVGNDENYFKKHDPWWRFKTPCTDYWGWPWEQGGVWDVLADDDQLQFLKGTVFLPSQGGHALNSVTDGDILPGDDFPFVLHGKGSTEMLGIRYITKTLLNVLETSQESLHSECPLLFDNQHLLVNVSSHYANILRIMMMT
jgi:hypothetical protein